MNARTTATATQARPALRRRVPSDLARRGGPPGAHVEHLDVLIIGAGLSGISAAWHLQTECAGLSYAIVEGRERMGGTWDLFRYPGIRSDSDMYTLGYRFRPWRNAKAIADGPSIKAYIEDTAREFGIDRTIRYRHRLVRAEWSSALARWTVDLEVGADRTPLQPPGMYRYFLGYDLIMKNLEKIKNPRPHNHVIAMM